MTIAELGKRIAAQHGWAAAKAFKAYAINDTDRQVLSQCAIDLLRVFPVVPGAAAPIAAALAVSLERRMTAPIHVMAGTLAVEGVPVFGPFDGFGPDWPRADFQGHAWVMIGGTIVDAALFRAAYAPWGPPRLARHVDLTFGPGKGLYVDDWKRTRHQGLTYDPQYVLSADEVTRLVGEAYHLIKPAT
jgi:hypothetical protein